MRRDEEDVLKLVSHFTSNKDIIPSADEAFQIVHGKVKEINEILKTEALRVCQEREAFDSVAKKLKHVHFSSTIKLNVGGQVFTTSLQTLTKDAGSMLHAMFSGRFDTKPAEDGSYFIDRDGTCFRYILNYLRTGKLILPDDKLIRKEVLEEATFYQIQGILDELNLDFNLKFYGDSAILSPAQRIWLTAIHGAEDHKFSKCILLYRGSRDGWKASTFHSNCDSFKGPTMVVIKSTGGYIFGGYTAQSWAGFKHGHHDVDRQEPAKACCPGPRGTDLYGKGECRSVPLGRGYLLAVLVPEALTCLYGARI
ncbi:hypothetical protein QZH41_000265 [Actinostola sp. cb2023]|nr:hypothetical protein QZH41_000265 [Actinostola sp. cb2023]